MMLTSESVLVELRARCLIDTLTCFSTDLSLLSEETNFVCQKLCFDSCFQVFPRHYKLVVIFSLLLKIFMFSKTVS